MQHRKMSQQQLLKVSILAKLVNSTNHSVKLLPKSLDSVVMAADSAVASAAALVAADLVVVSAAVSVASILTSSEIEI